MNTPNAFGVAADPANTELNLQEYLDNASGVYTYAGGYLTFEKIPQSLRGNFSNDTTTALASLPEDEPEVEFIASGYPGTAALTTGTVNIILQAPFSRGSVTINSSSVADKPVIDLGWLTSPVDTELAVAALKRARQIWASSTLGSAKVGAELAPGESVVSDADILAYIRSSVGTIFHATSTCSMGQRGDSMAVVDSSAKVIGVDGLRVVDASVIPNSVPGHPQATIYMLAEKIAAAIVSGN